MSKEPGARSSGEKSSLLYISVYFLLTIYFEDDPTISLDKWNNMKTLTKIHDIILQAELSKLSHLLQWKYFI